MAGRTHARAAAELAELRKIQNFQEKTQYIMNTLYFFLFIKVIRKDMYIHNTHVYVCPENLSKQTGRWKDR